MPAFDDFRTDGFDDGDGDADVVVFNVVISVEK
jgi:hypothetical protein